MSPYILVVEDDVDIRDAMSDTLALAGYRAATAADGLEALALLRHAPSPCLILLDLMMPVMDGWEFRAEQVRQPRLAGIPVIVFTAAVGSLPTCVDGVLKKPIDSDHLLTIVGRYWPG
jgi:CheY-like chemotaxis protein